MHFLLPWVDIGIAITANVEVFNPWCFSLTKLFYSKFVIIEYLNSR